VESPSAATFLAHYDSVRRRTDRVVERIPPARLEWSWAPGRFTCGDLVRHLAAIERHMFAENCRRRPSRYPGHGRDLADGWQAVMDYYRRSRDEARAIFAALSDADLLARCATPAGAELPVWKWLRAMLEHEAHHRGQLYLYLGILGVPTPPLYGLTSEQVRDRSLPTASEPSTRAE
jgi:uncharacterized damage-inducible protein DinB